MRCLVLILFVVLCAGVGNADTVTSGSLTHTLTSVFNGCQVDTFDWVSDTSGRVTASIVGSGLTAKSLTGTIVRVTTDPGDGATSPTDAYDVTLTDADGVDVLCGKGADLSASAASSFVPVLIDGPTSTSCRVATFGTHALAITNAGSARTGRLRVFTRPTF